MEANKVIKILDKALDKIPYKSVDINITVGTNELSYFNDRSTTYGFRVGDKYECKCKHK